MDILVKLAMGEQVTDLDIAEGLAEVCDNEHSSCSDNCPVYRMNGGEAPNELQTRKGCDCFGDGWIMLAYLRRIGAKAKQGMQQFKAGDKVVVNRETANKWVGVVTGLDQESGYIVVQDPAGEDWLVYPQLLELQKGV